MRAADNIADATQSHLAAGIRGSIDGGPSVAIGDTGGDLRDPCRDFWRDFSNVDTSLDWIPKRAGNFRMA